MMSLWDALRMNMMISYQELVRTFLRTIYLYQCYKEFKITNSDITGSNYHLRDVNYLTRPRFTERRLIYRNLLYLKRNFLP